MAPQRRHPMSLELLRQEARDELAAVIEFRCRLGDDPWEVPAGYDEPLIWHGLGLTPFAIVPHYRSRHPDAAAAEKIVSYMEARKVRHRTLADGEVIVRVGNLERLAS